MKNNFLACSILFFLLWLLAACSKDNNASTPASSLYTISGTAYYRSFYTGANDILPLANTMVYIRKDAGPGDTSNYFFSVLTDKSGKFSFYVPKKDTVYVIFASPVIKSSPSFAALYFDSIKTDNPLPSAKEYNLTATIDAKRQNGIYFTTQDVNNKNIPGTRVILYPSPIVAKADTNFTGKGSIYSFTTDSLGRGFTGQLPPDTYSINAILTINDKNSLKDYLNVVTVDAAGIKTKPLILQ